MKTVTYMQAFNEAIDEEMARDKTVFALGEDIGRF
jgi:pyruvate dehydrogenase E1 component beta subunit